MSGDHAGQYGYHDDCDGGGSGWERTEPSTPRMESDEPLLGYPRNTMRPSAATDGAR
jgi:hypothetical protein